MGGRIAGLGGDSHLYPQISQIRRQILELENRLGRGRILLENSRKTNHEWTRMNTNGSDLSGGADVPGEEGVKFI